MVVNFMTVVSYVHAVKPRMLGYLYVRIIGREHDGQMRTVGGG